MTNPNEAIVKVGIEAIDLNPKILKSKIEAIQAFQDLARTQLHEGHDFGKIPGCGDKPALLKPGAEKIVKLLNLADDFEVIERQEDWDEGRFIYTIKCKLLDIATGTLIATGIGHANSMETKWRYRWVPEEQVPKELNKEALVKKGGKKVLSEPVFAVMKKETGGKFGKPMKYWEKWEDAIRLGKAKKITKKTREGKDMEAWELVEDMTNYRVPNADIFDVVNTIIKICKKRALVDAALSAGRLSDLFTQDIDEYSEEAQGYWESHEDAPGEAGGKSATKDTGEQKKTEKTQPQPQEPPKTGSYAAADKPKPKEPPVKEAEVMPPEGEEAPPGDDFPFADAEFSDPEDGDESIPGDEKHKTEMTALAHALEEALKENKIDYKDFKKYLQHVQISSKRNYVGLLHGNLSVRVGDPKDLTHLLQNIQTAINSYLSIWKNKKKGETK